MECQRDVHSLPSDDAGWGLRYVERSTLACFEVIVQRLSQLVVAYRGGDNQNPNWRATQHLLSESSVLDVVPRSLEQYAHRLSKEEHEMDRLRSAAVRPDLGSANQNADKAAGNDDNPPLSRRVCRCRGCTYA